MPLHCNATLNFEGSVCRRSDHERLVIPSDSAPPQAAYSSVTTPVVTGISIDGDSFCVFFCGLRGLFWMVSQLFLSIVLFCGWTGASIMVGV